MEQIPNKFSKDDLIYLQGVIDKVEKLELDFAGSLNQWVTHIITIETGVLAVLVSFSNSDSMDCFSHLLFSSVLVLIGSSMLTGISFLYLLIDEAQQRVKFHSASLDLRIREVTGESGSVIFHDRIKVSKWKRTFKTLFIFFSILALIIFVIYGIIGNSSTI